MKRCALLNSFMCLVLAGCATGEWQAEQVPLPAATPFDANHFARNAFMEGFRQGYRAQSTGGPAAVELVSGPYLQARKQGFYAGAAQARAERTETEKFGK